MSTHPTDPSNHPDSPATPTAFELVGGEVPLRQVVDRFYDLMELEERYQALRATHGSSLDEARDKLFWFLCGWLGGPDYYQERFGHPRLRARHLPFSIGIRERDEWVACGWPEPLRARLHESFANTADWMRNRAG